MVIRPTRARHDSLDNNKYNSVPVASHLAHQVLLSDPENVKGLFRAGQLHLRLKNIEAAKVSSRKLSCRQYSAIWIVVALLYVHYEQLLCTAVSNNQGCTLFVFFAACHMARQWPWQRVGYHGKPWPWVTSLIPGNNHRSTAVPGMLLRTCAIYWGESWRSIQSKQSLS